MLGKTVGIYSLARPRHIFFSIRTTNMWNNLPISTDFSSLCNLNRTAELLIFNNPIHFTDILKGTCYHMCITAVLLNIMCL